MSERISQELIRELVDAVGILGDEVERLERVHARLTLATSVLSESVEEDS